MMKQFLMLPILFSLLACQQIPNELDRNLNENFPIANAVVSDYNSLVFLSGVLTPPQADDTTEVQALRVLSEIQATLEAQDLSIEHIAQMRVYLVGEDRLDGKLDFDGFNAAYLKFFNEKTFPARTVVQVAALPVEGSLVEVDVIAVQSAIRHGNRLLYDRRK